MRLRIGGEVRTGRAVDLRGVGVEPSAVAAAIRGDGSDASVSISCPSPGPVHEYVGVIRPEMTLSVRSALAAAARSRGHDAPQDDELASVRERLDAFDAHDSSDLALADARRRVADASGAETEARERVATLQGRVQALRETNRDSERLRDAEAELADATRRLSDRETERIAAEQTLVRAREQARAVREDRRERLRLRDRADNLRRTAREHLAGLVREEFEAARERAPGDADSDGEATDSVASALAVARIAALGAPVVVACDRFESAEAAARWLDAPVVRA
ncbi:DUF7856 family protein [Halorussus amylolyticus]|uniref:DUF7856 family protein n=1 Tax=Halorussus amylolyticus TaxID=1126242 RepID=UPI0010450DC3|nr:hypothetical protein [Halorussus amylolyticus]